MIWKYTKRFLTLYNKDQQKDLYKIVKAINDYDPITWKNFITIPNHYLCCDLLHYATILNITQLKILIIF